MRRVLTFRLGRTRPADVRSSDSGTLSRIRSLAAYITVTHESDFSEATGVPWQYDPVLGYHPNAGLAYCIGDSLYLGRMVAATARQRDHRQMASQRTRRTQRQHAAERG